MTEVVSRTDQVLQLVLEEGEVPALAGFLHDESTTRHALSAQVNSNRGRSFIIKMISYLDIKSLIEDVGCIVHDARGGRGTSYSFNIDLSSQY